ncbi:hypothetical protein ACFSM5_11375 [Lacibacterium aquatile]|uniref:Uncharacterized protein n=1 Tax=Lacibacterium aquatile TaxID=1168082 RepID=A0ABW5DU48_9PROT
MRRFFQSRWTSFLVGGGIAAACIAAYIINFEQKPYSERFAITYDRCIEQRGFERWKPSAGQTLKQFCVAHTNSQVRRRDGE